MSRILLHHGKDHLGPRCGRQVQGVCGVKLDRGLAAKSIRLVNGHLVKRSLHRVAVILRHIVPIEERGLIIDDVRTAVGIHVVGVEPPLHAGDGIFEQVVVVDGECLRNPRRNGVVDRITRLSRRDGNGTRLTNPDLASLSGVGVAAGIDDLSNGRVRTRVSNRFKGAGGRPWIEIKVTHGFRRERTEGNGLILLRNGDRFG